MDELNFLQNNINLFSGLFASPIVGGLIDKDIDVLLILDQYEQQYEAGNYAQCVFMVKLLVLITDHPLPPEMDAFTATPEGVAMMALEFFADFQDIYQEIVEEINEDEFILCNTTGVLH